VAGKLGEMLLILIRTSFGVKGGGCCDEYWPQRSGCRGLVAVRCHLDSGGKEKI
jgi:hypothetical protein